MLYGDIYCYHHVMYNVMDMEVFACIIMYMFLYGGCIANRYHVSSSPEMTHVILTEMTLPSPPPPQDRRQADLYIKNVGSSIANWRFVPKNTDVQLSEPWIHLEPNMGMVAPGEVSRLHWDKYEEYGDK